MKQTRILIADDHAPVRNGLHAFISSFPVLEWVGEASDGEEAVRLCAELNPDLVLMDIRMPLMDGITATQIIHQQQPSVRVIALSHSSDLSTIHAVIQAGAVGYIVKDGSTDELAGFLGVAGIQNQQPLVLVAENDAHLRGLFAKVLKNNHLDVTLATTGEDVIHQVQLRLPDVLILDLGLEETSPLELIRYIRQLEGNHPVKIIATTGNFLAHNRLEANLVDMLLLKPISPARLIEIIQEFLV